MEKENKLLTLVQQRIDWDTYSYTKKEDKKKRRINQKIKNF